MEVNALKPVCLVMLTFFLFCLSACQYNAEEKAEKTKQTQKRAQAASYNLQMGMGYLKQGDTPRAKRKFLTALELNPDSPDSMSGMAYFLEKTGDLKEARKYYLKGLALAPNSGPQLNNYGTFLCRTGDYKGAEEYFLKAVNDVNYVNSAGAYENAGLCVAAIPDNKKAEMYFVKALNQDPRRTESLNQLVSILLKQDEGGKALDYLKKYQEAVLNDVMLLKLAAEVAHQTGKSELEADYQERIMKLTRVADYTGVKNDNDNING